MKTNINGTDKTVRILLFFILLSLYISGIIPGVWRFILLGIALVLITTALSGFCIIYHLTNISTKTEPRHKINKMSHAATAGSDMTSKFQSEAFIDRSGTRMEIYEKTGKKDNYSYR